MLKRTPVLQTQIPFLGKAPVGQAAIQVVPMRLNPETHDVQVVGDDEHELQGYEQSLQTPLTGTA